MTFRATPPPKLDEQKANSIKGDINNEINN